MNNHNSFRNFTNAHAFYRTAFKTEAVEVRGGTWQGTDVSSRPEMVTYELPFQSFKVDLGWLSCTPEGLAKDIKPNLPWAERHFNERVCGWPINPGIEWENWPWNTSADTHRDGNGKFNHNYMERLWPRFAGLVNEPTLTAADFIDREEFISPHTGCVVGDDVNDLQANVGIYRELGDLAALVTQLANDPPTRQAVIPLYFPEDTGAAGRKPCTLLYQFMFRGGRLHMYYPLRSCDFVRHWRDDCYLAVRLLLWVLEQCRAIRPDIWNNVLPGEYHMHMSSFHIFKNDLREL